MASSKTVMVSAEEFGTFSQYQESLKHSSSLVTAIADSGNTTTCLLSSSSKWVIDSGATHHMTELQILSYADRVTNVLCKLCSLLVMLPGNPDQGVTSIHKNILSFLNSQSGLTLGMKIKVLCGLIQSSAALGQNTPPYHELQKKMNNVCLFYGDPTYKEELLQVSAVILQSINNIVLLESNQAARGYLALDACNCIASTFSMCDEISEMCFQLLNTAKLAVSVDNKYLKSTLKFLNECQLLPREDHTE